MVHFSLVNGISPLVICKFRRLETFFWQRTTGQAVAQRGINSLLTHLNRNSTVGIWYYHFVESTQP
jgi:hypothetical protein